MSTKISQLPLATSPVAPDVVLPVVQDGVTKKASIDQLGFLQSGTGATTRTIQNKLRDTASVKDFGAVGDGVADDTAAFTAAAAASSQVVVPSGTYLMNTAPTFGTTLFSLAKNVTATGAYGAFSVFANSSAGVAQVNTIADEASSVTFRRQANHTGGTPGFVSTAFRAETYVSAGNTNYEWALLGKVYNEAADGENAGSYSQGIKAATGATWGSVSEARDITGVANPTKGLVGIEMDIFANGTDSANNRVVADIVIGKHSPAGALAEVAFGLRIGTANGDITQGRVKSAFSMGVIEFDAAFDSSLGTQSSGGVAVKLKDGHKVSFVETNNRTMFFNSGALVYQVSGTTTNALYDDGSTDQSGVFKILGTQILTSQRTGYTNAMSGTANRGTAYATSSITLQQLAERVKAIEDDLLTHGLIGA